MNIGLTGTVRIVCTNTDTDTASILLTCSSNQMIHVISELYGRRTEENCRVVRDDSAKLFESDSKGLIVNCNGHAACTEHTACGGNCNNGTGHAFEVTYTCVENSENICGPFNQTSPLSSLYLHSPGFPNSAGVGEEEDSCECTVSGQSLEVLLIQHRGPQGDLQITTTGADNNTWTINYTHFNRKIASNVRSIRVTYTSHPDRKFWVRISGNITHVTCSHPTVTEETTETMETSRETTETSETTEATTTSGTESPSDSSSSLTTEEGGSSEKGTEDSTPSGTTGTTVEVSIHPNEPVSSDTTTRATNMSQSRIEKDSRSDVILIAGAVSGGVILLIVLIIVIVCVCRKKNVDTRAAKQNGDIQLTSDDTEHSETLSNMGTVIPNSYQSINDPKRITQICDNKIFEDNQELAYMSDCMVDNELYHSNTTCIPNKRDLDGNNDNVDKMETVATDLYHSHQADSKHNGGPRRSPQVIAKDHAEGEDVEVEDTQMVHGFHTLESDLARDGSTPVMIHDIEEDVVVTNDLYHSYRNPGNASISQDTEAHDEILIEDADVNHRHTNPEHMKVSQDARNRVVMEDNDLYHSYRSREGNSIPERPEDQDEMVMEDNDLYQVSQDARNWEEVVMEDNDLYHSFRSREGNSIAEGAADQDELVMEDNDLYHRHNNPELMKVSQDVRNREEVVMEDNDLYHSYRSKEGNSIPERPEDHDEMVMEDNDLYHTNKNPEPMKVSQDARNRVVMEDNDLYHSYRSREGNSIPERPEDQDEMVMEDNDLYHTRRTAVGHTENPYNTVDDATVDEAES